jgi:hypothetical protein
MKHVKLFEAFVNEGKSVLDLTKVQKEITKKCKDVDGVEITKGNKLTGIKELEIKSDWITSLKVKSDGNIYTDDSLSAVGGSVKSESELYKFVNQVIQQEVDYHKQATEESVNESDVKPKINRRGDIDGLIVTHNGNDYEIVYSSDFSMDGAVQPYGIVMPGDDVVSFLGKDKKAKSIWKQLKPKVDKFVKSKN